MMKFWVIFLFLGFFSANIIAQKEITHQRLHWSQIKFIWKLDSAAKWNYSINFQDRRYVFPNRRHHLFIKNSLTYNLKPSWKFSLGLLYMEITEPQNPFEKRYSLQMPEFRPTIAVTTVKKHRRFIYSQRLMAELRVLANFNTYYQLTGDWQHFYRLRWRNVLAYKISKFKGGVNAGLFNEVMLNFGRQIVYNTFDQNRLGLFVKQKWNSHLAIRAQFFNWFQQESNGVRYRSRYISGLGIFYKL